MYREALFDRQYKNFANQETKKLFTYVINESFYGGGGFDAWLEAYKCKRMGLVAPVYAMLGKVDYCDDYKTAPGHKDSEETLASRIILW